MIKARAGNDEIDGLDGADTLYGGGGDDGFQLEGNGLAGGDGADTSYGGTGNDLLTDFDLSEHNNCAEFMCTGRDTQHGGDGEDHLEGAFGGDFLYGEADADDMFGDPGNDLVSGGGGPDDIEGEEGSDDLQGGGGDDLIDASSDETAGSVDTVDCGSGLNDGVSANENDVVSSNCETIFRVPDATVGAVESAASSSSDSTDDEQEKAREEFLANNQ